MKQLTKTQAIIYHLYPGLLVAGCFIFVTPTITAMGYPPQLSMLLCFLFIAIPVLIFHLKKVKKNEGLKTIIEINGLRNRIGKMRLMSYVGMLAILAFILWGVTQHLDQLIAKKIFFWLPKWYMIQDFNGFPEEKVKLTLLFNLLLNGLVAPVLEEFYFRGYLLPRMENWGRYAFVANTILFSLYHFWQPYVYVTLIAALLPMNFLAYKTKDIRVSILTHSLINLLGALLSFGLLAH